MDTKRLSQFAALVFAAVAAYLAVLRPRHLRWGATEDEVGAELPGDTLIDTPRLTTTRAITVRAAAPNVWPWIVQLGQNRGGFYSYDWLENIVGADIHTIDEIVPELQQLAVGDVVRLAPEPGPAMTVAELEPERALVLFGGLDATTNSPFEATDPLPARYVAVSWAFVLVPEAADVTRLVVRTRYDWSPDPRSFLMWRVLVEPAHFVMERKMLLGIKERAERRIRSERPMRIDRYAPEYDFGFRYESIVDAGAEETYAAAKQVDTLMQNDPVVVALSQLRTLPDRVLRRLPAAEQPATAPVEQELPFVLLDEDPGREYVVGLVGQFWRPDAGVVQVDPHEFADFRTPGYAKTVFNFAVEPFGPGRSLLTSETRTVTADDEAHAQFGRYWRLIGPGAGVIMRRLLGRIKAEAEAMHAAPTGIV